LLNATHYYHKTTRRCIAVFGTLFNNIYVQNTNEDTDNSVIKTSRVPLAYGPKSRFLAKAKAPDVHNSQAIAMQLPRLAFEVVSFAYSPETTVSMHRRVTHKMENASDVFNRSARRSYTGTPYKLGIDLHIIAYHRDEALQILEQIIPYFKPEFTVSMKKIDEMESIWDMPITLLSISPEDSYEGDFESRVIKTYTLNFEVGVEYYGPITDQGVIHKVIANIYDYDNPDIQWEKIEVEAIPSSPSEDGYVITTTISDKIFLEDD
jgi:hypothetical protein